MTSVYDFQATRIDGKPVKLSTFRGKVLLIVNTASNCGFTPQFEGLEALHEKYAGQGLAVLGFPSNQFGGQDPGTNEEIGAFCMTNYGVSFPMMEKIDVNGSNALPLYQWLTKEKPGLLGLTAIKWNFTKFLIDRDGNVVERFAPTTKPEELQAAVEALL